MRMEAADRAEECSSSCTLHHNGKDAMASCLLHVTLPLELHRQSLKQRSCWQLLVSLKAAWHADELLGVVARMSQLQSLRLTCCIIPDPLQLPLLERFANLSRLQVGMTCTVQA